MERGRYVFLMLAALAATMPLTSAADDEALRHARELLRETILVDGHNDLPWAVRTDKRAQGDAALYDLRGEAPGNTDIERLKRGGLGAQFWSVYIPGELAGGFARTQLEQIDIARQIVARYPETFRLTGTVAEIRVAHREGRIASLLGIEGGHAIENSLGALRAYYDLGVRYMTLTHNAHTDWADSAALPPKHGGLTQFGEEIVLEMNRLGMLVDLSHTSDGTMDDALRVSKAPVIFSHSSARALCDTPRNVPDDILKRVARNGGVVMITFVAGFIDPEVSRVQAPAMAEVKRRTEGKTIEEGERISAEIMSRVKAPQVTIAQVADHIEHVRKVAGVQHIGIGADYDGNSLWPEGLGDVSTYPNLFAELIRRGWSDEDLKLLAGENVLRALAKAEETARTLRARQAVGSRL